MKTLAALIASLVLALCAHAAEVRSGMWSGQLHGADRLQLQLSSNEHENHFGFNVPIASLKGVTKSQIESASSDVRFEIVEAAGTLSFDGHFRNGIGAGEYRFTPNAAFAREMESLGIRGLRDEDLLVFTVEHFQAETARGLLSLGYSLTRQQAVEAAIFKITPEAVREYASLGYPKLRFQDLVQFRIGKVDAAYISGMRQEGYTDLTAHQLGELAILKVTPEFVHKLAAAGYKNLKPQQLINYRIGANVIAEKSSEGRRRDREQR
jgi:hypothetical protein